MSVLRSHGPSVSNIGPLNGTLVLGAIRHLKLNLSQNDIMGLLGNVCLEDAHLEVYHANSTYNHAIANMEPNKNGIQR